MLLLHIPNMCSVFLTLLLLYIATGVECSQRFFGAIKTVRLVKDSGSPVVESDPNCNWCVWSSCTPSVLAGNNIDSDDAHNVAEQITNSLNLGVDFMKGIIPILTLHSELQRQQIDREFRITNKISILDTVKGLTLPYSVLKKVVTSLATPLPVYFAKELHKAIKKRARFSILEIYTTLPACITGEINKSYGDEGKLENEINKAFNGYFNQENYIDVLLSFTKGERDSNREVDKEAAKKEAEEMVTAMDQNDWKLKFLEVFTKRSIPQLNEILNQYDLLRKKEKSIEADLKNINENEKSKDIYKYISKIVRKQHNYYAEELNKVLSKESIKRDEIERLIFIIRGRCDIDLGDIKTAYSEKYAESLYNKYSAKYSGKEFRYYREVLLRLIKD